MLLDQGQSHLERQWILAIETVAQQLFWILCPIACKRAGACTSNTGAPALARLSAQQPARSKQWWSWHKLQADFKLNDCCVMQAETKEIGSPQ